VILPDGSRTLIPTAWTDRNGGLDTKPSSTLVASDGLEPKVRDEGILDSIKTHVLKKVARIGLFWRFTWRVRCEGHRRFCRSGWRRATNR
jgi:hypothetical protein